MTATLAKRAYRFRFYPTVEQERQLRQTFECVRFVWNYMLEERTRRYRVDGVSTSYSDASSLLTQLKRDRDHLWLNEVSSVPLQQCLRHQGRAMTNFFEKRASYPKFKKKSRGTISAEYTRSAFKWHDGTLKLAKMAEPLRVSWSRETPSDANPSTVTVSMDASGRFFVSMLFECAIEHHEPLDNAVGIDIGVSTWAALSEIWLEPRNNEQRLGRAPGAYRV